jgi:hypothetical protein
MSKRNGETMLPDEPGIYDFWGKRDGRRFGAKNRELEVIDEFGTLYVMEGIPWSLSHYEGRWWGPKQ